MTSAVRSSDRVCREIHGGNIILPLRGLGSGERRSAGEARRDPSFQRRPKRSSQLGSLGGKVTEDREPPREGDGSMTAMEGSGVHRTRTDKGRFMTVDRSWIMEIAARSSKRLA